MASSESSMGRIDVGPLVPASGAPPIPGRTFLYFPSQTYTWSPRMEVCGNLLPQGFQITMRAIWASDGLRRFRPEGDLRVFLLRASLAGMALLQADGELTLEQSFNYHAMRLILQRKTLFSEYLDRAFDRKSSLEIRKDFAIDPAAPYALPEDVGLDPSGAGTRWSPTRLIDEGRRLAGGISPTSEAECIRLGFYAAARLNPYPLSRLTEDGANQLIRMAIFDSDPLEEPLEPVKQSAVEERFLTAIERHLKENDDVAFDRWFLDNNANIVHAISKQKSGIQLSREEVSQGLVDLTYRSFRYAGDCIHRLIRDLSAGLPEPINGGEQQLLDTLYAPHRYWGGLSLVMLEDRFEFLGEARDELLRIPDDSEVIGVALRLLDWYGRMARLKRADDRTDAQMTPGKSVRRTGDADEFALPDIIDHFSEIASTALHRDGLRCDCKLSPVWKVTVAGNSKVNDDPIRLTYGCRVCKASGEAAISWAAIRAADLGSRSG